jgi:hypothetical protein
LEEQTEKARNLDYQRNHQNIDQTQEQNLGTYIHYQHGQLLQNEAINSYQTEAPDKQIFGQIIDYAEHRKEMGMKSAGGEIVQVQGGHIVRSTGRKDRHSKVYTAKGPRDRRVFKTG